MSGNSTISRHIQLLVFAPIYSFYNSNSHESDSTHMFTVIDYVFIILYIFGYSRVSSPFRRRNVRSATGCNSQSSSGFPSNLPKPDNGSIRHHECGPSNGVRSILCRRTRASRYVLREWTFFSTDEWRLWMKECFYEWIISHCRYTTQSLRPPINMDNLTLVK